jgi:hypothetical protein
MFSEPGGWSASIDAPGDAKRIERRKRIQAERFGTRDEITDRAVRVLRVNDSGVGPIQR